MKKIMYTATNYFMNIMEYLQVCSPVNPVHKIKVGSDSVLIGSLVTAQATKFHINSAFLYT